MPRIPCSIPSVLDVVRVGECVWFDDGKLGGVVDRIAAQGVVLRITYVQEGGRRLTADRGINFPESALDIPGFTAKDRDDLDFIAHADTVGLSFAQRTEDIRAVRARLAALGRTGLDLILKIETRRGFESLPHLLLETGGEGLLGVMIARGDLSRLATRGSPKFRKKCFGYAKRRTCP